MDTSWIELPNNHEAYKKGVTKFKELAKKNLVEGRTRCPCKKCKLKKWLFVDEVENHILFRGFLKSYKKWIYHGNDEIVHENVSETITQASCSNQPGTVGQDDMRGLLDATFGPNILLSSSYYDFPVEERERELVDDVFVDPVDSVENSKYEKLIKSADEELYPGCCSYSKLSFLLNLFHLKTSSKWSAESLNMLLKLLIDAFPQIMGFPTSYYECKKLIKDLGLKYKKIDAYPNDCILYWGDSSGYDKCPTCKASRWKKAKGGEEADTSEEVADKKGGPAKVFRYFPLIPRLKRIYMSPETAENMVWHDKDRVKDGMLRHPTDGLAWTSFHATYPEFSSDSRNVRLGLASDGFNPYRLMNTTYSTWHVVLIPYNFPPWLAMKPSSFILSMIIPGPSGLGNKIDVYLQPLIEELKQLWEGVDVFDSFKREWFKMCAALTYIINDFPAYAMLSGWSTKGYKACPCCTNSISSYSFGGKICYFGCRKWLPDDHPYRLEAELFDGTNEYGRAPVLASGTTILRQQEEAVRRSSNKSSRKKRKERDVGTSSKRAEISGEEDNFIWKKRSIFFDLPYWEHTMLRHNLDVMHIEKNVSEILLGTILGTGKCRDDVDAREAIKFLGVKPHLWLERRPNRDPIMPLAPYTLSLEEKDRFLNVLHKLRVLDGYGSNISRCVNLKKRKLIGLKSHDNHVIMQDILPVALRASGVDRIVDMISELSSFFKYLCSTTLDISELDAMQDKLIITLCEMEKLFLPTFFTIMVHLLLHLVEEAKLGGPNPYRWMYPVERYLADLKSYVTNKAQPEGSIAEGYILEETEIFCSRYLEGVETIFSKSKRNDDTIQTRNKYLFESGGRVAGMTKVVKLKGRSLKQVHRYVLLHSDEMSDLKAI